MGFLSAEISFFDFNIVFRRFNLPSPSFIRKYLRLRRLEIFVEAHWNPNESDDGEDETTIGQILTDLPNGIKLPPWMSKSYDDLKNERLNSRMKNKSADDFTNHLQGTSSILATVHILKIISLPIRVWCGNWINNKKVKLWLFTSNVCSELAIELFKGIENSAKKFEIAQKQALLLQEKFQIRESTEDESKFYDLTTIYTSINGNVAKKTTTFLIYMRRLYRGRIYAWICLTFRRFAKEESIHFGGTWRFTIHQQNKRNYTVEWWSKWKWVSQKIMRKTV